MMGCFQLRRAGRSGSSIHSGQTSTSIDSGQTSTFDSQVSAGSKPVAEATLLEMSRLLKIHQKALRPSIVEKLFVRRNAVLRASVQNYHGKLRMLQSSFKEKTKDLPHMTNSAREGQFNSNNGVESSQKR